MMSFLRKPLLVSCAVIGPTVSASLTFPAFLPTITDTVLWSQLGAEFTTVPMNFAAVSGLSVNVAGLLGGTDGITVVVGSAWLSQPSGFVNGDTLIWAENSIGDGSGPITLSFPAHFGAGAYLQSAYTGQYSATLDVFDTNGLIGSHPYTSNANGDPIFMGVVSDTQNITKVVFSVTATTPFGSNPTDFAIDTLLFGVPESSTVFASASLLALLLFRVHQKHN